MWPYAMQLYFEVTLFKSSEVHSALSLCAAKYRTTLTKTRSFGPMGLPCVVCSFLLFARFHSRQKPTVRLDRTIIVSGTAAAIGN